jgi:hypothetical protein
MTRPCSGKYYFWGSAGCLMIAVVLVVGDAAKWGSVAGATANCEQLCYDDSLVFYECRHNPAVHGEGTPERPEGTCDTTPTTQITSPTGCIKNILYFSFCESASSAQWKTRTTVGSSNGRT